MKYIRKIASLLIAVVLLAAIAIGTGVIFSVRNVNVNLISYYEEGGESGKEEAAKAISAIKLSVSEVCKGSVISFVKEDEVRGRVEEGFTVDGTEKKYTLENFEKIYPCTVNITVKERRATFAIDNGDGFDIYDEEGVYLRASDENINKTELGGDGAPFVVLEGVEADEERVAVVELCTVFGSKDNFSAIRAAVDKVTLIKAQSTVDTDRLTFSLRCGLTVVIQDYRNSSEEKISRAAAEFATLTGEQKLSGTIYCFVTTDGRVSATYGKN